MLFYNCTYAHEAWTCKVFFSFCYLSMFYLIYVWMYDTYTFIFVYLFSCLNWHTWFPKITCVFEFYEICLRCFSWYLFLFFIIISSYSFSQNSKTQYISVHPVCINVSTWHHPQKRSSSKQTVGQPNNKVKE